MSERPEQKAYTLIQQILKSHWFHKEYDRDQLRPYVIRFKDQFFDDLKRGKTGKMSGWFTSGAVDTNSSGNKFATFLGDETYGKFKNAVRKSRALKRYFPNK